MGSFQTPIGMRNSTLLETSCGFLLQELQARCSIGHLFHYMSWDNFCYISFFLLKFYEFRLYGMKLEKISSRGRRFCWIWSKSVLKFTEEKLTEQIYQELICIRNWQRLRLNSPIFFCPLVNDLYLDGYLFHLAI